MDTQFQTLPPLKRLRLMQREQQKQQELRGSEVKPSQLPTKKRRESRVGCAAVENAAVDTYCLPAKKRVWAIHPELLTGNPLSPFDLNLDCCPSFDEEKEGKWGEMENPDVNNRNKVMQSSLEVEDKENIDPLVKEDIYHSAKKPIKEEENITSENEEEKEVDHDEDDNDDEDDGIVCAVCQSTDGHPSDPIVFCDECDLMVHATCYGNPLVKSVPEDDWFCNQCLASKSLDNPNIEENKTFSCCLCPIKNGALKTTKDGRWAHIVCSLFVPEVFFDDPEGREGINCSEIPKRRWKERCYICKSISGCTIECSEMKCPLAFHVTCGLKEDLCIEYREDKKKGGIVAGFCKDHTTLWEKQQQTGKFKIVARDSRSKSI